MKANIDLTIDRDFNKQREDQDLELIFRDIARHANQQLKKAPKPKNYYLPWRKATREADGILNVFKIRTDSNIIANYFLKKRRKLMSTLDDYNNYKEISRATSNSSISHNHHTYDDYMNMSLNFYEDTYGEGINSTSTYAFPSDHTSNHCECCGRKIPIVFPWTISDISNHLCKRCSNVRHEVFKIKKPKEVKLIKYSGGILEDLLLRFNPFNFDAGIFRM